MKVAQLAEGVERTFAVVFDTDDEAVAGLEAFAAEHGVTAGRLSGIGAFRRVTLGYFEWATKDYREIEIADQVEVVALLGDVALADGKPKLHAHVVVADRDGTAKGGHLMAGVVRPTLEVLVEESPAHLHRVTDPTTGLALIQLPEDDRP